MAMGSAGETGPICCTDEPHPCNLMPAAAPPVRRARVNSPTAKGQELSSFLDLQSQGLQPAPVSRESDAAANSEAARMLQVTRTFQLALKAVSCPWQPSSAVLVNR